jgi:GAF domain-containing protein
MLSEDKMDAQSAFDELGHLVLGEQSMDELLERIAQLAKRVVRGADEVSITLAGKDKAVTVVSTGQLAVDLDERQYEQDSGPCLDAAQSGSMAFIPNMSAETRWPQFTTAATERGVHSSLSTPIPLQQYSNAAINMYATTIAAFTDEDLELAQSFAGYAGVALANMHLYQSTRGLAEQLQSAMESRAVIEQAKGMLMAQNACDANGAFDLLVRLSQQSNRKLRDVAQAVVDSALKT